MNDMPREYVGTITENGEAYCYGVGFDEQNLVYLDVAGPTETIKTIRAKLVGLGRLCYLNPPRGRTLYLQAASSQVLDVYQKKIAYGLVHAIFVHQALQAPLYHEQSTTYLLYRDDTQIQTRLGQHIQQLLPIPVREVWHGHLWEAGRRTGLIKACETQGGVELYSVMLDQASWTRLIQDSLQKRTLTLTAKGH